MRAFALSLLFAASSLAAETTPAEVPAAVPAKAAEPAKDAPPAEPAAAAALVAPVAPVAEVPVAPVAPVAPVEAVGMLSLTSTPAGKVFVDDKDTGLTTPITDLSLPAGKHVVKIVAEDGSTASSEFMLEGGGSLSLNLNLPAAEVKPEVKPVEVKPAVASVVETPVVAAPVDDWNWMTVSGWAGLGVGTIGLLAGAVVLTTPTDADQVPLGYGLFGGGVGMVLGGAVLLYLDNELTDAAPVEAPKAASLLAPVQ